MRVNEISRQERLQLVRLIKEFEIEITDLYDIDAAIVTGGGVNVKEINPKRCSLKLLKICILQARLWMWMLIQAASIYRLPFQQVYSAVKVCKRRIIMINVVIDGPAGAGKVQ